MQFVIELGMKADSNGDGGVDHIECSELTEEFEKYICHEFVAHCGGDD